MTDKGDKLIHSLDGTVKSSSIEEVGSVNEMIYHSVKMHPKRKQFFADLANANNVNKDLFDKYLTVRFRIKNILGKLGLFNAIKKIIK